MIRTAESVSPMHPDKLCDQVSDAILDECLRQDPDSRVAVEVMGGHGIITVTGELTTKAFVDVKNVVSGIVGPNNGVQVNLVRQSPEIANGVDNGGAGDQGIMVGYACNETLELMPLEYVLARDLCKFIYEKYPYDGKTQVTLDGQRIMFIVASFQKVPRLLLESLVQDWLKIKFGVVYADIEIYGNPAGDWNLGGFEADTGLTGRKLMIDNYGPRIPVGGGAFSGKDATKVDRSAAYMARKIAVDHLVKLRAEEVYVYLAYAIGRAQPLQATVIADGKEFLLDGAHPYNLTPKGIIKFLNLKKPQYQETAKWGHFGNKFTWDQ